MSDHNNEEGKQEVDPRLAFARSTAHTPRDFNMVFSQMNVQEGHGSQEYHPETGEPFSHFAAAPAEEQENIEEETKQEIEKVGEGPGQQQEEEFREEYEQECQVEEEYEQGEDSGEEYEQEYYQDSRFDDGGSEVVEEQDRGQGLAKLLEVEDFLTELMLGKPSLMQLLREPDVIKELITFSLGMPYAYSDNEDEDFAQRSFRVERRTDVAFQTLSSDFVLEVVILDEELLDHLFAYLDAPTGNKESNHFSRIVMVFLDRFSHDLMLYLRSRDGIVARLVRNVEDQTIVDLLYKFVDVGITHQWLYEENLLKLLVDGLNEARTISSHRRVCFAQVMSDVLHFCCRWVSNSMLVSEVMENEPLAAALLEYTLSEGPDRPERLKEGLIVFSIMLQLLSSETSQEEEPPFIRLLCKNIPLFISLLQIIPPHSGAESSPPLASGLAAEVGGYYTLQTSAGVITPTIGTLRLQIADFFCALLYCGFPVLQAYLLSFLDLFPLCVDLLFHYKWNNILHNVLTRILSAVFECSDEEMVIKVLDQTQLLKRLVIAFNDETATGNKGHLLQLCQECLRAAQVSSLVADYTYSFPLWEEFVSGRLDDLLSEQEPQMEEEADDGFIGYDEIVDPRWGGSDPQYDDGDNGEEYYDESGL